MRLLLGIPATVLFSVLILFAIRYRGTGAEVDARDDTSSEASSFQPETDGASSGGGPKGAQVSSRGARQSSAMPVPGELEDPQQALEREIEGLYLEINKPGEAAGSWTKDAMVAFEEARAVIANVGEGRATGGQLSCSTNGCAAKISYAGMDDYRNVTEALDQRAVMETYPRVITGPVQEPGGRVTNHIFLFVGAGTP